MAMNWNPLDEFEEVTPDPSLVPMTIDDVPTQGVLSDDGSALLWRLGGHTYSAQFRTDEDEIYRRQADARVKEAARRGKVPLEQRGEYLRQKYKKMIMNAGETGFNLGIEEGKLRAKNAPLADRVKPDEVDELAEHVMRKVLADDKLRAQYVAIAKQIDALPDSAETTLRSVS
jgi:hypothetical protein